MLFKPKQILISIFILWLFYINYNIKYSLSNYDFVQRKDILKSLHYEISQNVSGYYLPSCNYMEIIYDDATFSPSLANEDLAWGHMVKDGGEYVPVECSPKISTAIIVPYRNSPELLHGFLVYMHRFLRQQNIHYQIFVIEQVDNLQLNSGYLLNIGAEIAVKAGFPCLILHDVDLLPLKLANLYACTTSPRHMSSIIDNHRNLLKFITTFGGVVAITSKQYYMINGMSNTYSDWRAELSDLYHRLKVHNLKVARFDPIISQYHMAYKKEAQRNIVQSRAQVGIEVDGLNSLHYAKVGTVLHRLFTHIMVDLAYHVQD